MLILKRAVILGIGDEYSDLASEKQPRPHQQENQLLPDFRLVSGLVIEPRSKLFWDIEADHAVRGNLGTKSYICPKYFNKRQGTVCGYWGWRQNSYDTA